MRIRTSGKFESRERLYDRTARKLGASSRVDAIDASCRFVVQHVDALGAANEHPDMTDELREILSSGSIELQRTTRSTVTVGGDVVDERTDSNQ